MSEFLNVEAAYEALAAAALQFPGGRSWDSMFATYGALEKMVSVQWSLSVGATVDGKGKMPPKEERDRSINAVRFLRDDIRKTTGQRIWGLTFTLYPSGKFNIEYSYDKPEGYEETDETISLDEALDSFNDLWAKVEFED